MLSRSKPRVSKMTDFLLTPRDFLRGVRYDISPGLRRRDKWGIVLFIFAFVMLVMTTPWQAETIFFLLFILSLFYYRLDARLSIGLALICLIAIPLLSLIFKGNPMLDTWTERIAVWAYYFLAIGVIKQILDLWRDNRKHPSHDSS